MEVFVVDAVRTPVTAKNGALGELHAVDLGAVPLAALVQRNPEMRAALPAIVMGCATPIGEQGLNVANACAVVAGLDKSVASTLDAGSNSGIRALLQAAALIEAGLADVAVGAAVSSMTRIPNGATAGVAVGKPYGPSLHARFESEEGLLPPGMTAEAMAQQHGLNREDLDHYVMASVEALNGVGQTQWKDAVVPVTLPLKGKAKAPQVVAIDERLVDGTPLFAPADFVPAFDVDGVVTAGNSSGQADGAAAVLLASASAVKANGWKPVARLVGASSSGSSMLGGSTGADVFTRASEATKLDNVEVVVHEDFAVTPLAFQVETGIKVNRIGGALGLGDPHGAGTLITFVNALSAAQGAVVIVCAGATNQQDCAVIAP